MDSEPERVEIALVGAHQQDIEVALQRTAQRREVTHADPAPASLDGGHGRPGPPQALRELVLRPSAT